MAPLLHRAAIINERQNGRHNAPPIEWNVVIRLLCLPVFVAHGLKVRLPVFVATSLFPGLLSVAFGIQQTVLSVAFGFYHDPKPIRRRVN